MGVPLPPTLAPCRLGIFLACGDGPARWEVESLSPDRGRDLEALEVARNLLDAINLAPSIAKDCSFRWRVANEIVIAWRDYTDAIGRIFPELEIEHTHGAPVPYRGAYATPQLRLYMRHRKPTTEAELRQLRALRGVLIRGGRRYAIRKAIERGAYPLSRRPAVVPRKAFRVLYRCNPGESFGLDDGEE